MNKNENKRVTLNVTTLDDLKLARPSSESLFKRLLRKVTAGESIKISLSRADLVNRQTRNGSIRRDDSDAGLRNDD